MTPSQQHVYQFTCVTLANDKHDMPPQPIVRPHWMCKTSLELVQFKRMLTKNLHQIRNVPNLP
jgi:hypothetical protein